MRHRNLSSLRLINMDNLQTQNSNLYINYLLKFILYFYSKLSLILKNYFIILFLCCYSFSQDYLWPIQAKKELTAVFGEERPGRYHMGIDVRTFGEIGYKLIAIEDGYISRIRTSSKGYGKTIYLKLIDGNNIINHQNINMGIAVALPNNNLIVPVIKSAEEKNFLGLSRSIDKYAQKARSNSLEPDEIFGSTFTVTNPGIFGGLFGMAIINQPNVGLLSVGSIHKRPVVKETEYGDVVVVRSMMYLTLAYDHRLIDGAYGTKFLNRLKELLESFSKKDF